MQDGFQVSGAGFLISQHCLLEDIAEYVDEVRVQNGIINEPYSNVITSLVFRLLEMDNASREIARI